MARVGSASSRKVGQDHTEAIRSAEESTSIGIRAAWVGLLIGAVIALLAALIVWEWGRALSSERDLTHLGWVLASAVIVGVTGARLGLPWVDPVVGLVIAAVIVAVLCQSMRTVVHRLMDGVDPATVAGLAEAAAQVPGVSRVGEVRARWLGHRLEAELVIGVDAGLTVEAAHHTSRTVTERLRSAVPHLDRATVALEAAPRPVESTGRGASACLQKADGFAV